MKIALLGAMLGVAAIGRGQVIAGGPLDYQVGGVACQGFLAYDSLKGGKRPAVLIIPDWNSIDDYEIMRANMLAKLGYVALVADIYGKEVRPKTPRESGAQAGKYKGDRKLFRERLMGALETLKADPRVDRERVAAIGYCFGGTGVLELARMGANLRGVASFHGGLDADPNLMAGPVVPKILILHGADDPLVPAAQIQAFRTEFANAKMEFVSYEGAVHSFSNPNAGNNVRSGNAYNERADKLSWAKLQEFLRGVFK